MIIPVWEDSPHPESNFEIQEALYPKTHYRRMLIQDPTVDDLKEVGELLIKSGVPATASITFSQWNVPDTNWYVHAHWED